MSNLDIVCIGTLVADIISKNIDKFPQPGKLELIDHIELHCGGNANTTGIALVRLGMSAAIIGKVGDDYLGKFLLDHYQREGINSLGIKIVSTDCTSTTLVMVAADGERTFLHASGVQRHFTAADVDFDIIATAKILHLAGCNLLAQYMPAGCIDTLRRASQMGVRTSFDTVWNSQQEYLKSTIELIPYLDIFMPSLIEGRVIFDCEDPREIAMRSLELGAKIVAVKLAEQGCLVSDGNETHIIPAFSVDTVDTTGAGDAWAAGFLTALHRGFPLPKAGKFANAVGACSVQAIGGTAGIKNYQQTMAMMDK